MKKSITTFTFVLSALLPGLAFAVTAPTTFAGFVAIVVCLVLDLVPIIILFAFAEFIRGLINYVGAGDSEEKRTDGINYMIYGMIGFFVMVGIWGILNLVTGTFGHSVGIPQFVGSGSPAAIPTSTAKCSSIF